MASPSDRAAGDARSRFKDRVRQWREEAIVEAVGQLLVEQGCQGLTMDDIAKRVGIAKGSLYLHTNARSDLVAQVLDRWTEDIPEPSGASGDPYEGACHALFAPADHGGANAPAIPCCLHTSPCPNGWEARWAALANAYGLEGDDVPLIGDAVQALAATPALRAMVAEGRLDEAKDVVRRFVIGYRATAASRA